MPRSNPASRVIVTARDEEVLLSLYRYRTLSLAQVERLHFVSAQTTARRMRLLAERGYVTVFRVPGVTDRLVMLAGKGTAVVAAGLGVAPAVLGRAGGRAPKDHYFLRHALAVTDVRINLDTACRAREDLSLLGFLSDGVCRRTPAGGMERYVRDVVATAAAPDRTLARVPDGVFALSRAGKAALFFVEVDRGTESVTNPDRGLVKVIRFYLSAMAGTGYQRYREDFRVAEPFRGFRALITTTSAERVRNIRRAGGAIPCEPAGLRRFIWLAETAAVTDRTILGPIWSSLDPTDNTQYAIAPGISPVPVARPAPPQPLECVVKGPDGPRRMVEY